MTGLQVCVIGAESTGKSTLLAALLPQLQIATGLQLAVVPELLRAFSAEAGRPPARMEQIDLIAGQRQIEDRLNATNDAVLSDSAPLAIALYSQIYFGDNSLLQLAKQHHCRYQLTLVTHPDFAWQPDSARFMRDGPQMQQRFHASLLGWLAQHPVTHVHLTGTELERHNTALDAILERIR